MMLIRGSILQFGDVPVTVKDNIPAADIVTETATTIEFTILKEHVGCPWEVVVADPLSFLAKANSALRPSGIITSKWSITTFNDAK